MKYNNKITIYNGVKYHSALEATYAEYLDVLKRKKKIEGWTRQVNLPFIHNGIKICSMVVDFLVHHKEPTKKYQRKYWNNLEYVEIKGMETDVWKIKYKMLKAFYPDYNYTVLKRKDLQNLGIVE